MKSTIRVKGLDRVLTNLRKEMKNIPNKMKKGLIQAGLLVQRGAQKNCPVKLGNLKASAFTVWGPTAPIRPPAFKGENAGKMGMEHARVVNQEKMSLPAIGPSITVEVGFSAYYALYVHERAARHEVGDWKFLERSLYENQGRIIGIVKENAKI